MRLRLCGERAIDVADASGTLLFDVARARVERARCCEALEVDRRSGCRARSSRPRSSGETADGMPVAAGAGDQAAGALGVGVGRGGRAAVGRARHVRRRVRALPAFAADPEARVHAFCHAVPETWHAMGVMLSAAGSLRWLRDTIAPGADFGELVRGGRGAGSPGWRA